MNFIIQFKNLHLNFLEFKSFLNLNYHFIYPLKYYPLLIKKIINFLEIVILKNK